MQHILLMNPEESDICKTSWTLLQFKIPGGWILTNVKSKNSTFIKANLNRKKDKITIFLLWNTTEQFRYEDNTSKRTSSSLASVSHSMIFLFDVDLELNSLFVFTHQEAFLRIRCGKIKIKVRLGRKHFTGIYSTFTFSSVNKITSFKMFWYLGGRKVRQIS